MEAVSAEIKALEEAIARLGKERYPDTILLQQVAGAGPIFGKNTDLNMDRPASPNGSPTPPPQLEKSEMNFKNH